MKISYSWITGLLTFLVGECGTGEDSEWHEIKEQQVRSMLMFK